MFRFHLIAYVGRNSFGHEERQCRRCGRRWIGFSFLRAWWRSLGTRCVVPERPFLPARFLLRPPGDPVVSPSGSVLHGERCPAGAHTADDARFADLPWPPGPCLCGAHGLLNEGSGLPAEAEAADS